MFIGYLFGNVLDKYDIHITPDLADMIFYMFSDMREPREIENEEYEPDDEEIQGLIDTIIQRATKLVSDADLFFVDAYIVWYVVKTDPELSRRLKTDYIDIPPGRIERLAAHVQKVEYPAYSGLLNGYSNQILPSDPRTVTEKEWNEKQAYARELFEFLHNHFMQSDIVHLNLNNVYDGIIRLAREQRGK